MKIALDANAYSDWKRGILWMDEIPTADEVHVSATVIGELCYGFACGNQEVANVAELDVFFCRTVGVSFYKREFLTGGGILAEWLACVL